MDHFQVCSYFMGVVHVVIAVVQVVGVILLQRMRAENRLSNGNGSKQPRSSLKIDDYDA